MKSIFRNAVKDNITGEAAKAAFYFFLSLFPLILAIFAITGIVGGVAAFDRIMAWLQTALPEDTSAVLEGFIREVTHTRQPGALSVGLLLTLWGASSFFAALADGLNTIYGEEGASWVRRRGKALLALIVGGIGLTLGAIAILAGPELLGLIGISEVMAVVRWPAVFVLLVALLWWMYYVLPDRDQGSLKREILLGATVAATLWLVVTAGFRLYVSNFANYGATYGALGAVIILMLWLYLSALAILMGGETAHTIEQHAA